MFIPDPDFCPSRILIQKQKQKKGVKKNWLSYLFCRHKNHKIVNYINFELVKKKIWANLQTIMQLSTQKIVIKGIDRPFEQCCGTVTIYYGSGSGSSSDF